MSNLAKVPENLSAEAVERALIMQDLSGMKTEDRLAYYKATCESLGLNPLTRPFAYINLSGKVTLYALKDCTEQLRKIHSVSIQIVSREVLEGVYVVTARATTPHRHDESIGAVNFENLRGDAKANAIMKAETKAKRRVTLSICGLGMLDETEVDSIPTAKVESEEELAKKAVMSGGVVDLPSREAESLKKKRGELTGKPPEGATMVECTPSAPVEGGNEAAIPQKPAAKPREAKKATPEAVQLTPSTHGEPVTAEADDLPWDVDWRGYQIVAITIPEFNGKKLGELSQEQVGKIYKGWVLKYAEQIKQNPVKVEEAKQITLAYEFHNVGK